MKIHNKNLIELHSAVFLFGFAALFGKFLNFHPIVIVCGRALFAAVTLLIILLFSKKCFRLNSRKDYLFLASIGIIYAIHWLTFFKSIQVSNVAIAVLTFSTFPIFVTFLEPFFFKEQIRLFDIMTALITLSGVSLVVPSFELSNNLTQGVLWGIGAGFTCAILTIANRKNVEQYSSILISFYQNLTAGIVLIPFMFYLKLDLSYKDLLLLILLGVLFTAITHALYINSLTTIKVQLASIITCLEPVYAILFAAILLKEIPTTKTVIGGLVILGSVFYATINSKSITKSKLIASEH